ncbi:MAG: helix-hairpin-helix domain-containing protein [Prevotellaceae bacterium]|jgi:competence ComEA-like helix-hairpin-helix protein|nr:helix-hairpin-helix domain-containing protein [Prevotellaceae bacterium]
MFKQFLYFSKGQKIGLLALLGLLVLIIAANFFVPKFVSKPKIENNNDFITQYENFRNSLKNKQYQKYSPFDEKEIDNQYFTKQITLFTFNPNELDSAGFVKLGLKPFIAKNIVNYRKKGGKFRTTDDFAKIYGISDEKFAKLKPYIKISAENLPEKKEYLVENQPQKIFPQKKDTIIELNSADTTDLKKLRGIGSGWAKAIVAYRQKLGGYYSVNQLLEIKNFPSETFERIEKNMLADVSKITQIEINRANVDFLRQHPYLNFYQSKAIYELRRKKEVLTSIDDLKPLPDFSAEQLQKIAPYLNFKKIERKR